MITISKDTFDSMDDAALIWACIEPSILEARGRSFSVKTDVYAGLTESQRALFMFQVLYGHTSKGFDEFCFYINWLLSNKGVWQELKKAVGFFGAYDLVNLLGEIESSIVSEKGVGGPEFTKTMERYYKPFSDILPAAVKQTALFIRNDPGLFIQLTE